MISLDTETTGLDLYHRARPYFVTICYDDNTQKWWEWSVCPISRMPIIPEGDIEEIQEIIDSEDVIVGQNNKFDISALQTVGIEWRGGHWSKTEDTLTASHLLASLKAHDLTSLGVDYLGINIQRYEDYLEEHIGKCRREVQQARLRIKRGGDTLLNRSDPTIIANWAIAEEGLSEEMDDGNGGTKVVEVMPSAKEKCWKYDGWLPLAYAKRLNYPKSHPYYTVLSNYANADSATTMGLWNGVIGRYAGMEREIKDRKLWAIYKEKLKGVRMAYDLERNGVTYSGERLKALSGGFKEEATQAASTMLGIAKRKGYDLKLPKGAAANGSLRTFIEDILKLPPRYSKKSKTDAPSLDKEAMAYYKNTLPPKSLELTFIQTLLDRRELEGAIGFMRAYERFGLEIGDGSSGFHILHPHVNPTGSATLRWTCSSPNEQNISKQKERNVRYCFGPKPGREWWSFDFKNLELRLPFYKAGEKELIDLFERPNDPPFYGSHHLLNFSIVYPEIWEMELKEVGIEKVGPHCKDKYKSTYYQWVKNGDFAVQYGAGDATADATFRRPGARAKLIRKFTKLTALNEWCIRYAEKHGYIETMPDRSIDPYHGYPLMCSRTDRGEIEPTIPFSYYIQGTAMWLTHRGMVRCQEQHDIWEREDGFDGFLTLQVHDELDFDWPKAGIPTEDNKDITETGERTNYWRACIIKELMEQGGRDIGIPCPVGITYHGSDWQHGLTLA